MQDRDENALPRLLDLLEHNEVARLHFADAISGAEVEAHPDASWDEILLAAISDLRGTPAGQGA